MTSSQIQLFSTDLDGTLLGNPEACWRFTDEWTSLPVGERPILVYNTGRTALDTRALARARNLPEADFVIGSVGTELLGELERGADEFQQQFVEGWDRDVVQRLVRETPGVWEQPSECQHCFKSSWYWVRARRDEVNSLTRRLQSEGIRVHVDYSCRYFLDILPARAGKGSALSWLCGQLQISLSQVLVAGDTAHDSSMFHLPRVSGIVVENALPELLDEVARLEMYQAQHAHADGVIEGLYHFGVLGKPAA